MGEMKVTMMMNPKEQQADREYSGTGLARGEWVGFLCREHWTDFRKQTCATENKMKELWQ